MASNNYICLNGEFLRTHESFINSTNRAFRYNDAITENIHATATEAQFLDLHIERLTESMHTLSMQVSPFMSHSNFTGLITNLLNKNRIFGGAHIRLTVFRNAGDPYIPLDNEVSFLIESAPLERARYELNEKGLTIGISQLYTRNPGPLAHLQRANNLLFMLAALEGKKHGIDAVILLNQAGRLTETTDSNLFLVSGNSVFTPGLEQGCIPGIMRKIIINCLNKSGFRVNDQSSLTSAALFDAEEVFLTNTIEGIKWAGGFQQKRYFSKTSRLITSMLNDFAFEI